MEKNKNIFSNNDILDLFESNIENLQLGIIEENNFQLVRTYLSGKKDYTFRVDENDPKFLNYFFGIDAKHLNQNISEIKRRINDLKESNRINDDEKAELKIKVDKLKANAYDYFSFINAANNEGLEKIRTFAKEYEVKIIYGIIELRASLGLSTDYMLGDRVYQYCSVIANDVNNKKYKRLNFNSHVDSDGNINC